MTEENDAEAFGWLTGGAPVRRLRSVLERMAQEHRSAYPDDGLSPRRPPTPEELARGAEIERERAEYLAVRAELFADVEWWERANGVVLGANESWADRVARMLFTPCGGAQCTPNMTFRKIPRDVHEDARDQARALMGTPEFAKSRGQRKRVEMRFAHLKTHHRFERMRLRGFSGARDEFHLAAIVQNLKTLASYFWRPPPHIQAVSCA